MKKPEPLNNQRGMLAPFLKFESQLKRYLLRILISKEDVEDVLQETYLRASHAADRGEVHSPKHFLYKVAKNLALSEISRKSHQIISCVDRLDALDVLDDKSDIEAQLAAKQELQAFYNAVVLALPPVCRKAFLLRKAFGYTHKEIAIKLGISVSTVEKHLMKGLKLYDEFTQQGGIDASDVQTSRHYKASSRRGERE